MKKVVLTSDEKKALKKVYEKLWELEDIYIDGVTGVMELVGDIEEMINKQRDELIDKLHSFPHIPGYDSFYGYVPEDILTEHFGAIIDGVIGLAADDYQLWEDD